jgi:hypothetical protein
MDSELLMFHGIEVLPLELCNETDRMVNGVREMRMFDISHSRPIVRFSVLLSSRPTRPFHVEFIGERDEDYLSFVERVRQDGHAYLRGQIAESGIV